MSDHEHDHLPAEVQVELERLAESLGQLHDPATGLPLDELDAEIEVGFEGGTVFVGLTLGYPCAGREADWDARLREACLPTLKGGPLGEAQLQFELFSDIPVTGAADAPEPLRGVKNIVAVASGKGGVGKSTTAVNLALALAAEGASVGLLDADIYGPSLPTMLGTEGVRPDVKEQKFFLPVEARGLKTMSLGYLMTEETPAVWRGPMASGALNQILTQTLWGELDYLFVDMPPGTGDIQLTLAQNTTLAGAVIVTTPQDLALKDAIKGVEMFRKVSVPVLGIVENMSLHTCSQCGHSEPIFGSGGGERIAADYQTRLLGQLPLTLAIREDADGGLPTVASDPEGEIAGLYRDIARRAAAQIWLNAGEEDLPQIEVS
ncbi:iron-sulfur cluster carrier protein ApbC [Microbulbifer thermotolerans]|uniref:Iron-sulfur cluster carrier protein n=2 Tax=Microbulbifer thermotolerans TaxID=252514 RepID=A0AB35HXY4_MICTH|nr:iron-sulfur cluster carrier protein ApbC [Microbulbifer thermotolerans]MCX2779493.1 iron-sulfur cluster carrier protein ApbC [Microbulbifer thermotolerans]MCX2793364.1 iron-sulfur cluster carrier protein ApbC [Microbulbifer thermotolerans]MCX2801303.1 iron-sulfur cluster carrier protein ApbC [Microbulbifer thermotolerans]MCX2806062.1 iron-sulfur cluster carrier protein ApbC [Microbulbifer thermotolerans]SFC83900.1 ATP-binding protein involved in chromosome partitioning [Microbulbifer thermo